MRFQQLKSDPNNISRKKMVKTNKGWIVVTSLVIAGGIFLYSSTLNVEAATTTTAPTAALSTNKASVSSIKDDTSSIKPEPVTTTTQVQKKLPVEQSATTTTNINNKTNPKLNLPNINTNSVPSISGTLHNIVNSITGKGKAPVPPTNPSQGDANKDVPDNSLPTDPFNNKTNIANGVSNTSHWYISEDKTLHFIDGTLQDNAGKTASPWSNHSDDITSASFDGHVQASVHMNNMFSNLPRLTHIDNINNVDFGKTTDMSGMLSNDSSLTSVELNKPYTDQDNHLNFDSVTTVHGLFENDAKLTTVNMDNHSFKNITDYSNLFKNDTSLSKINTSGWQMLRDHDLSGMFQNDTGLKNLDIRSWDIDTAANTGDSTKNSGMFDGTNFSSITLGSFNHFSKNTALPSNVSNNWQETDGSGNTTFSTEQLSTYYPQIDNHGKYEIKTFTPKPGNISGNLTIHTTIGNNNSAKDFTIPNVTGNYGDIIHVNAPVIDGYTPDRSTVTVEIQGKGNVVVTDGTLHYTGNTIHDAVVTIPTVTANQSQTVSGITGKVGDKIPIKVPQKVGYTSDSNQIYGTINAD